MSFSLYDDLPEEGSAAVVPLVLPTAPQPKAQAPPQTSKSALKPEAPPAAPWANIGAAALQPPPRKPSGPPATSFKPRVVAKPNIKNTPMDRSGHKSKVLSAKSNLSSVTLQSSQQTALVQVEDEYDPAQPNNYDDYLDVRHRKEEERRWKREERERNRRDRSRSYSYSYSRSRSRSRSRSPRRSRSRSRSRRRSRSRERDRDSAPKPAFGAVPPPVFSAVPPPPMDEPMDVEHTTPAPPQQAPPTPPAAAFIAPPHEPPPPPSTPYTPAPPSQAAVAALRVSGEEAFARRARLSSGGAPATPSAPPPAASTYSAPPPMFSAPVMLERDEPPPSPAAPPANVDGLTKAQRMMANMGWKGQGLGKQEQGIAAALQVKARGRGSGVIVPGAAPARPQQQVRPPEPVAPGANSRVALLKNMVGPGQVDDDLQTETETECGKYGKVVRCFVVEIPGKNVAPEEAVKIYIKFETPEAAAMCVLDMGGRFFGGREVRAEFYDETRFDKFDLT